MHACWVKRLPAVSWGIQDRCNLRHDQSSSSKSHCHMSHCLSRKCLIVDMPWMRDRKRGRLASAVFEHDTWVMLWKLTLSILCFSFRLLPLLFSVLCLCAQAFLLIYFVFFIIIIILSLSLLNSLYSLCERLLLLFRIFFFFFPSFLFMMPCLFKLHIQLVVGIYEMCSMLKLSSPHADNGD